MTMPRIQANVLVGEDVAEKFVIGRLLRFLGYIDEMTGDFVPGDVLRVRPTNACGMGIDVERVSDGRIDMVWPDEVEAV